MDKKYIKSKKSLAAAEYHPYQYSFRLLFFLIGVSISFALVVSVYA